MTTRLASQQHLEELAERLAQESSIQHVLFLTDDGLPAGGSRSMDRDTQDKAAATANGMLFTARSSAQAFTGSDEENAPRVSQAIAETDRGVLMVMGAGQHTILAVWAVPEADLGVIGYKMAELTSKLGQTMDTPARSLSR